MNLFVSLNSYWLKIRMNSTPSLQDNLENNSLLLLMLVFQVGYSFGMVFLVCELGLRSSNHFENMYNEMRHFNWYMCSPKVIRIYAMFIQFTQQDLIIPCFGSISCDRKSSKKVNQIQHKPSIKQFYMLFFCVCAFIFRWSIVHSNILWWFDNFTNKSPINTSTKLSMLRNIYIQHSNHESCMTFIRHSMIFKIGDKNNSENTRRDEKYKTFWNFVVI